MADKYKVTPFRHTGATGFITPGIIRPGLVPKIENERGYTYSYSGADCRAYCWFSDKNDGTVHSLKSLATISLSIHDAKSPVRRLGHRSVSGFTESIRTIAGSIVFTIIEDHPLKALLEQQFVDLNSARSIDEYNKDLYTTVNLEPINILLKYKTEVDEHGGNSIEIRNVRFLNEGEVTSVSDMVTEMVVQFVAEDAKVFEMESTYKEDLQKFTIGIIEDEVKKISNKAGDFLSAVGAANAAAELEDRRKTTLGLSQSNQTTTLPNAGFSLLNWQQGGK